MEAQFALVDAAYCFLSRHRATLSVRNVVQMVQSLSPGALSAADLRRMAARAPELLVLHTVRATQLQHRDDVFRAHEPTPDELELLTFPLAPQPSKRASDKRKKLFAAALQTSESATGQEQQLPVEKAIPGIAAELPEVAAPPPLTPSSPWVALLRSLPIFRDQLVHVETREAREASYVPLLSLPLPPAVTMALEKRGIQELYAHQHASIAATLRGDNVVLSTATASGKSLAFNVPTLARLVGDPQATFIYLFPTKALAQDQLKSLRRLLHACGLPERLAATFDGDTPMTSRSMVIRDAHIFLTNPDTLHLTILPKHTQWKTVLANLQLLVIDEAHMYRGVFGAHVASVFRRLFRLCALYGSNPRVVCCSATIRNPESHFRMLLPKLPPQYETPHSTAQEDTAGRSPASFDFFHERPLCVITQDGAPAGEKVFCLWNPKASTQTGGVVDPSPQDEKGSKKRKRRRSASEESKAQPTRATDSDVVATVGETKEEEEASNAVSSSSIYQSAVIFARLVAEQVHTLLFCKGRKLSELVLMSVHAVLKEREDTKHLIKHVQSYRGGYTVEDRRRIEARLFQGELLGVIATNALELGIDIGELDCTMHLGLPGSISSLWQQAGRAGRRKHAHARASLAVIVCFDAPLDQHFARHATELFALAPEAVALNANNAKVVAPHLLCAASEFPLFDTRSGLAYIDTFVFGSPTQDPLKSMLRDLAERQQLSVCTAADGGGFRLHSCVPKSVRAISLRSISDIHYQVVTDDGEQLVIDEIPGERVFFQVYPTAVYLHQAQEYIVTRLDTAQKIAFAKKCAQPLTYFTTCRDLTDVEVVKVLRRQKLPQEKNDVFVCEGDVSVTTSVFGSTLVEKRTMRVLHTNEFSLPPMQSFGHALWLELPHALRLTVEATSFNWSGALHGAGHMLMAVIPLVVLCDAGDINTEHYNPFERRQRPNRITIFERREGGSGLVKEILESLALIVTRAHRITLECACRSGCPSCVHSAQCSEYNKVLDKRGALLVLAFLAEAYGAENEEGRRLE